PLPMLIATLHIPRVSSFLTTLRPPPSPPLFPYTTLFRSGSVGDRRHLTLDDSVFGFILMHKSGDTHMPSLVSAGPVARAGRCGGDRKSTRLNSSHVSISYAVFCLKKKRDGHDDIVVLSNN